MRGDRRRLGGAAQDVDPFSDRMARQVRHLMGPPTVHGVVAELAALRVICPVALGPGQGVPQGNHGLQRAYAQQPGCDAILRATDGTIRLRAPRQNVGEDGDRCGIADFDQRLEVHQPLPFARSL